MKDTTNNDQEKEVTTMTKEIAKRIAEIREALFMLDMKTRLTIEDWNDICQLRREEAELMNLPKRNTIRFDIPTVVINGVKCMDLSRYEEEATKHRKAQEEADRVWMAECDNIRNTINRLIEEL
jgi:hypothetical protein